MDWKRRFVWLVPALVVVGCSAQEVSTVGGQKTGSTGATTTSSTSTHGTDSGETSTGTTTGTTTTTEVPEPFDSICPSARWLAPDWAVLAFVDGERVRFLRADGTWAPEEVELRPDWDYHPWANLAVANRDYVGLHLSYSWENLHLVIADRTGHVLAEHTDADAGNSYWLFLGDDGSLVAEGRPPDADQDSAYVLMPNGEFQALEEFDPNGPMLAGGWVPGHTDTDPVTIGWMNRHTLEIEPVHEESEGWKRPYKGRFVYGISQEGSLVVVDDAPDGPSYIPMGATGEELDLEALQDTGWALTTDGERTWRVHVEEQSVEPYSVELPHGLWEVEDQDKYCNLWTPRLEDGGRLLFLLRDSAELRPMRLDPSTGTWELLGRPLSAVAAARLWAFGRTYAIWGFSEVPDYNLCFGPEWSGEPSEDALLGESRQVVRPDDDVYHWFAPGSAGLGLNPDGTCALLRFDYDPETLVLLDVIEGTRVELEDAGHVMWLADPIDRRH